MTPAEAKAKWKVADDLAYEKRRAYIHARLKEQKLGQAYQKALEEKPDLEPDASHKLVGEWYEAERQAEKARVEAKSADNAVEKAEAAFKEAVARAGG